MKIEEMIIAAKMLQKIYGTKCTIENVSINKIITMTNGTQWLFDKTTQNIKMIVD